MNLSLSNHILIKLFLRHIVLPHSITKRFTKVIPLWMRIRLTHLHLFRRNSAHETEYCAESRRLHTIWSVLSMRNGQWTTYLVTFSFEHNLRRDINDCEILLPIILFHLPRHSFDIIMSEFTIHVSVRQSTYHAVCSHYTGQVETGDRQTRLLLVSPDLRHTHSMTHLEFPSASIIVQLSS